MLVHDVVKRAPAYKSAHILKQDFVATVFWMRSNAGRVRRDDDVRHPPECVVRRQRLDLKNVKRGAC